MFSWRMQKKLLVNLADVKETNCHEIPHASSARPVRLRWAYYTGNQVRVESSHPAKPRALVMNDLSIKPAKGPRDEAGALLAVAEPGQGHVIVVTDAGWVTDSAFDERGVGGGALTGEVNWDIYH